MKHYGKKGGHMATLEQVEKLRKKVDCSYEEARAALDANGGDMLDALIYLERQGRQSKPSGAGDSHEDSDESHYSTRDSSRHGSYSSQSSYKQGEESTHTSHTTSTSSFGESVNSFFAWLGQLIKRGNANKMDVIYKGEVTFSLPLTALVLLLFFAFYVVLPVMLVALLFGVRFQFRGKDFEDTRANEYMDNASEAAEKAKTKVKEEWGTRNDNRHYKTDDDEEEGRG